MNPFSALQVLFILLLCSVKTLTAQSNSINLAALGQAGTPGWEPFNGAKFEAANEDGRTVVRGSPAGVTGDRGAFLKGVKFAEGVIEIDLKGSKQPASSFVGVVFHGEDGSTYDAVYFRPFNFNQPDPVRRSHAVQYMSHPDWDWQRLRAERPGKFEAKATPEPAGDAWFHARIEVKGRDVKVYINDAKEPCLNVIKLSQTKTGKVGLWFNGVAAFANFKIDAVK